MSRISPLVGILVVGILAIPTSLRSQARPQSVSAPAQNPSPAKAAASDSDPNRPQLHERNPRYRLESGDILELAFRYTPEFDQEVTIQPDGYVQLKGLQNDVHIQGQTVPEVIDTLKKAYSNTLRDPVISVVLREFEKPYFIVGGEVGHPGKFDLRGDTTVVEALEIAGGLRDSAKHSEVQFFKRVEGGWAQAKSVNVKKLLQEGNLEEANYLQPGDFIYVPKNAFSKIARFLPTTSVGAYVNPLYK